MSDNTSVTTVKDEVSGVFSRLCSTACSDDKAIKLARDNLRRLALRIRDGEADYEAVVQCCVDMFHDDKTKDEWFVKYRLLEVFPIFARAGDTNLVSAAGSALLHDNWMVRQAGVEALTFVMSQKDQPHIASRPGSKSNSRPLSPKIRRQGGLTAKPRPKQGLVVGEPGAVTKGRRKTPSNEKGPTIPSGEADSGAIEVEAEQSDDEAAGNKVGAIPRLGTSADELETALQTLHRFAKEAMAHEEAAIRKCGLDAMSRSFPVGHALALEAAQAALADSAWECREAALVLLRETAVVGDQEVLQAAVAGLEDVRWEVREAAVRVLQTVGVIGDEQLVEEIVTKEQHSKGWAGRTGRKAWELREAMCKALGCVATADNDGGVATLTRALSDESSVVQRAAARALGEVAEREAPADMVWTYNNATAVPAKPSTWQHHKWSALRQQHVPASARAPAEGQVGHSPRETLQLVVRTPRGGPVPHLLTTPRNEHLYHGDAVHAALELREQRREALEREEALEEAERELRAAVELGDADAVRRLQAALARLADADPAHHDLPDLDEEAEDDQAWADED